jgi:hypothetical protein
MTKRTLTITHPDGTVSTRGTARDYTHAVVLTPREPQTWRTFVLKTLDARIALLAELNKMIESAVIHRGRSFSSNPAGVDLDRDGNHTYMNFQASFGRTGPMCFTAWCDSAGNTRDYRDGERIIVPVADFLIDQARRTAELWAKSNAADVHLIAAIDAGTADRGGYRVVRWSTRRDLAERAVAEFDGFREHGHGIEVQPVD